MRILVTGASGGIGSALVELARRRGDYVIGVSRKPSRADLHINCDASDFQCLRDKIPGGIDGIALLHGHGDARLWNAGLEELEGRDFLEVYAVDVVGSFNVIKAALPRMNRGGSIVLTASTPGLVGDRYGLPYSAAKGAIVALTKSLARVLAPIRVNAVAFGPVETGWTKWISQAEAESFRRRTLLKRLASPQEAAEAIYWLLSPHSSYVTGQVLVVDGGESLSWVD